MDCAFLMVGCAVGELDVVEPRSVAWWVVVDALLECDRFTAPNVPRFWKWVDYGRLFTLLVLH